MYASHLLEISNRICEIQKQHSKASVYFDTEHGEILISYPLPKDFLEVINITSEKYD